MASKTANYNLDMPGYTDIADIDVINGNMDKIDVQMKKNADSARQSRDIVSDEYSATKTYAAGDYCIHENILYKCKTKITTGEAFDSNKWVQTACGLELGELNSNLPSLIQHGSDNALLTGWTTISFDKKFNNIPTVIATIDTKNTQTDTLAVIKIGNITTESFDVCCIKKDFGYITTTFSWVAIG